VFTCPEIALSSNFREKVIDQQAFKDQLIPCVSVNGMKTRAGANIPPHIDRPSELCARKPLGLEA
jgi:hypothetical protein